MVLERSGGDDGIMVDGSFHQHGPQLQSGAYGEGFFVNSADLITLADNTSFSISDSHGVAYAVLALDGVQWEVYSVDNNGTYGVKWDVSAVGRGLSRKGWTGAANTDPSLINQLRTLDFNRSEEFQAFADRLAGPSASSSPFTGDKHFHLSDYHVHHDGSWFGSVRMFPTRIIYSSEYVNDEVNAGCILCSESSHNFNYIHDMRHYIQHRRNYI